MLLVKKKNRLSESCADMAKRAFFRRLTLRSATGTAQRAVPTNMMKGEALYLIRW
jgi:hypothetical protein